MKTKNFKQPNEIGIYKIPNMSLDRTKDAFTTGRNVLMKYVKNSKKEDTLQEMYKEGFKLYAIWHTEGNENSKNTKKLPSKYTFSRYIFSTETILTEYFALIKNIVFTKTPFPMNVSAQIIASLPKEYTGVPKSFTMSDNMKSLQNTAQPFIERYNKEFSAKNVEDNKRKNTGVYTLKEKEARVIEMQEFISKETKRYLEKSSGLNHTTAISRRFNNVHRSLTLYYKMNFTEKSLYSTEKITYTHYSNIHFIPLYDDINLDVMYSKGKLNIYVEYSNFYNLFNSNEVGETYNKDLLYRNELPKKYAVLAMEIFKNNNPAEFKEWLLQHLEITCKNLVSKGDVSETEMMKLYQFLNRKLEKNEINFIFQSEED